MVAERQAKILKLKEIAKQLEKMIQIDDMPQNTMDLRRELEATRLRILRLELDAIP